MSKNVGAHRVRRVPYETSGEEWAAHSPQNLNSQALSTVEGQKAADLQKHCARGGTRTAFPPLQTLGTRENMRNSGESEGYTRQSETESVDNVHTS
jgi:hypothetical protein